MTPEQRARRSDFQYPTGLQGPLGTSDVIVTRYDNLYGPRHEALARLAVNRRHHSLPNGNACPRLRKPITGSGYWESNSSSAAPLPVLDSVMVCGGANAARVTGAENARRRGMRAGYPTGYAELMGYTANNPVDDSSGSGFSTIRPTAVAQTGRKPGDIQSSPLYDDFSITIMLPLERIGFRENDSGADFVLDHDMPSNETLPLNTRDGQISAGPPGLADRGLHLVEAIRQMFGEWDPREAERTKNATATGMLGNTRSARQPWTLTLECRSCAMRTYETIGSPISYHNTLAFKTSTFVSQFERDEPRRGTDS